MIRCFVEAIRNFTKISLKTKFQMKFSKLWVIFGEIAPNFRLPKFRGCSFSEASKLPILRKLHTYNSAWPRVD